MMRLNFTFEPVILAALAFVLLSGCATSYQPEGFSGGYSEIRLNADTFEIDARGNGFTSTKRAKTIALLRAAELMINNNFDRFVVLSGETKSEYAGSTPVTVNQIGNTAVASGGEAIFKPQSGLVVRGVRPNDAAYASALDAKLIYAQLRPEFGQ